MINPEILIPPSTSTDVIVQTSKDIQYTAAVIQPSTAVPLKITDVHADAQPSTSVAFDVQPSTSVAAYVQHSTSAASDVQPSPSAAVDVQPSTHDKYDKIPCFYRCYTQAIYSHHTNLQ